MPVKGSNKTQQGKNLTCTIRSFVRSAKYLNIHTYNVSYFDLISNLANHDMPKLWIMCTAHMLVAGWGGSMRV